jgi:hypothetical protein
MDTPVSIHDPDHDFYSAEGHGFIKQAKTRKQASKITKLMQANHQ